MHSLPAYVALARLVLARRVVVVLPTSLDGPRCLLRAGAREVLVISDELESEDGIVVRPGSTQLPMRDRCVDVVCCVEALGTLPGKQRRGLLTEAHRVLRSDGLFVAWLEQAGGRAFGQQLEGSPEVDFWTLEEELATLFDEVAILAQIPWRGFSVAPVVDDEHSGGEPGLALEEGLLETTPEASHYLAIAGKSPLPPTLGRDCVLVPIPDGPSEVSGALGELEERVESMRDEIERLREELSMRAAKGAAAQGRVRELEQQLETVRARAGDATTQELRQLRGELTEAEDALETAGAGARKARENLEALEIEHRVLREQHDELTAEHAELRRRLDERALDDEGSRGEIERLRRELEAAREGAAADGTLLRSRETDLTILTRSVADQEKALARVNESLAERKQELDQVKSDHQVQRDKLDEAVAEREELRRQVDVLIAEREGARTLAARVEAQLEVANRKLGEQGESLAAKIQEASRLDAAVEAMRHQLGQQEAQLEQTRERAEELSAKAAQGQMLTEVALDRDRLRAELSSRQQQITKLEERLWESREGLQKERLEAVRLGGEVDRLKEQLDRSRVVEKERTREVAESAKQLRVLEVQQAELSARLEARNERIEQLQGEAGRRSGASEDAKTLNEELQRRGNEVARLKEQLAQVELRRQEASRQAEKREEELRLAGERASELQRAVDDQARLAASLQAEIDVKTMEIEQLAGTIGNLQKQAAEQREVIAAREQQSADLQRTLEDSAAEQRSLRQRLREREQKLEDLVGARETDTRELFQLRKELETASENLERLEATLTSRESALEGKDPSGWPAAALSELRRLEDEVAVQARRHADELAKLELEHLRASGDLGRVRRLQLEAAVRATEQEYMLRQLDGAEQKIWEMTDASDRNAARFEASLANLEKHKEEIDRLSEELEVTRSLLGAEQARALELERLLASERAKMARAGLGIEGLPASEPDDPFADLAEGAMVDLSEDRDERDGVPVRSAFDLDSELVRLSDADEAPRPLRAEPGSVGTTIDDRGSGRVGSGQLRGGADRAPKRARIVVEAVGEDDDEEWPEDDADS